MKFRNWDFQHYYKITFLFHIATDGLQAKHRVDLKAEKQPIEFLNSCECAWLDFISHQISKLCL